MNKLIYAFSWMKKRRLHFILGTLFQGFSSFLFMYLTADFISGITGAVEYGEFRLVIAGMFRMILGYAAAIVLNFAGTMLTVGACLYAAGRLRSDIVRRIISAKVSCLNNGSSEEVINAFTSDISSIFDNLSRVASIPVNILFVGAGGLWYAFALDIRIGIMIILFGLFKVTYGLLFAGRMKRISCSILERRADFTSSVKQLIDNPVSIRMNDMKKVLHPRYNSVVDRLKNNNIRYGDVSGILGAVNNITTETFSRLILYILGKAYFAGDYGLTDVMREKEIASNALRVFSISRILTDTQIILAGTERVIEFVHRLEPEEQGDCKAEGRACTGIYAIEYDNVSFSYGEKQLLQNIRYNITEGSITILRGESGTGKTTLLRLAQGIYLPDAGIIRVHDRDIREWNLHSLRERLAYVPQQPLFFSGTIGENIAGRLKDIDQTCVIEAARKALVYEKIMELPKGFETLMTDNESRFSGGEQKRLMLARVFYKAADILLLDELTAAVDEENEKLIYDILLSMKGKMTIVFATHRTLAERIADQIIEL